MNNQGFMMLITLTVLGLVTAMVLNVWFITGFQYDVAHEREQWHKNFCTTRAALDRVVTQIARQPVAPPCAFDMSAKCDGHRVLVSVAHSAKRSKSDLLINAVMSKGESTLCALRCVVTKKIVVTAEGKRVQHEVHGFTIA